MNSFALSGLLIGITTFYFACLSYFKNRKKPLNRVWALYNILAAIWGFGAYEIGLTKNADLALFLWRFVHIGVIFIPIVFLHFVYVFLEKKERWPLIVAYASGFFFLAANLTGHLIRRVEWVFNSFYYDGRPPTFLYVIFTILWFLTIVYAHIELFFVLKRSTGLKKDQIKYFFFAILLAYAGGGTCFLPVFGLNIYPYGNFTVPLYPIIMTYAILKYQLMDIRIVFTRAGIFLAVYTIVLGMPFIVLKRTGSGLLATSLAVIFATIGPLTYRFLQMKAEALILAQQRRYQRILLRAAGGMVTEHDLARLSKLIVFTLKNTIRLNFSAIFIIDKKNNLYQLKSIRGESNIGECVKSFDMDDPFISYLKENHGNFFFENAPNQIKDSSNILSKSKIVIPVLIGEELFGFVFLGEKTNTLPYSNEDINVFKILSRQAALAIENCIFFEESKDAQERMFAAEKLASIGGMADGIAHQIKNRLNLFSLTGGELKIEIRNFMAKHDKLINSNPELDKTFKYLNEIAASILDNVKRTDSIIKGILDFAKVEKKENLFAVFSFKETVKLSSRLLMLKHETASIPLSVKIDTEDAIYGVKSQLTEVIYNLLDNAYEAIEERKMQSSVEKELESFVPAIGLSLTHTQGRQIIKISDNGIGMKEEDKPKIFAPFFTTKTSYKSGSGIGVYVVKRIIEENHKGKIWFSSDYMKGTSFVIELPKKPTLG